MEQQKSWWWVQNFQLRTAQGVINNPNTVGMPTVSPKPWLPPTGHNTTT